MGGNFDRASTSTSDAALSMISASSRARSAVRSVAAHRARGSPVPSPLRARDGRRPATRDAKLPRPVAHVEGERRHHLSFGFDTRGSTMYLLTAVEMTVAVRTTATMRATKS